MNRTMVAASIDHAVLKPEATDEDLRRECEICKKYEVASTCVKPSHVSLAAKYLQGSKVKVCTVIGFPHGSTTTAAKVAEALEMIEQGAEELDMVLNVGKLLSGDTGYVLEDIQKVVEACHARGKIVKVIIETSLLTDDMKVLACQLSEEAGADYVKTSTGFNGGGANTKDIEIMKNAVSSHIKLKASGGVKTLEQAIQFLQQGCTRLGTSATVSILEGRDYKENY